MPKYLRFRVELMSISPRISRTFLIGTGASFAELHDAIQTAGPWASEHSYYFGRPKEGRPLIEPDGDDMSAGVLVAESCPVLAFFRNPQNSTAIYVYDLGGCWKHSVTLEAQTVERDRFKRRLIAGTRAFPKEGMNGISEYRECVAIAQGKASDTARTRNRLRWLRGWDPEFFDLEIQRESFDRR
ncbi:MAG: hypothetical protein IT454_12120 [Planctomycetes bacterium]|nr:hypothetical protein [Planctomycetota bacterium]